MSVSLNPRSWQLINECTVGSASPSDGLGFVRHHGDLLEEPDRDLYVEAIAEADSLKMSAATLVELSSVCLGQGDVELDDAMSALLISLVVEIVPVSSEQASAARQAQRRFGKGRHRARLNLGDTFSYALAMHLDEPLLYKVDDFAQTDVRSALAA